MTKLLTEVMRQIVELPDERQDDAARVLMLMLEEHDRAQYRLTGAQLREVDEAIGEVDAGMFASEVDIDRVLHRSWA